MIRAGKVIWGTRVLAWALHYLEDLSQPFHATQVPALRMLAWRYLLAWPPQEAFKSFVAQSTRTVSNYHWAYEGYVVERLKEGSDSVFANCLRSPATIQPEFASGPGVTPLQVAQELALRSRTLAPELGRTEVAFFGRQLKSELWDLSHGRGRLNTSDFATRPDLTYERKALDEVTCKALANGSLAARWLIHWALQP
jgi:hypothetical protein